VVANGTTIQFYSNGIQIAHADDDSYSSGVLGLFADASSTVEYSNARVWTY
jgi:hypothetical protein